MLPLILSRSPILLPRALLPVLLHSLRTHIHSSSPSLTSPAAGSPSPITAPLPDFRSLSLPPSLLTSLQNAYPDFSAPTPFQSRAIPSLLETMLHPPVEGPPATLLASPPNTGKTLAYLLPAFAFLQQYLDRFGPPVLPGRPLALVLLPTRELAEQTARVATAVGRSLGLRILGVHGGMGGMARVRKMLGRPIGVLVGTPGAVGRMMAARALFLGRCGVIVVDEADVIMDAREGFVGECPGVLGTGGERRKGVRWVYVAATVTSGLLEVLEGRHGAKGTAGGLEMVTGEGVGRLAGWNQDLVETVFVEFGGGFEQRLSKLVQVVWETKARLGPNGGKIMVFCDREQGCERAADALAQEFEQVECVTGGLNKEERERRWENVMQMPSAILVCTDVVGRGLDVQGVGASIMLEVPDHWAKFVHRVGRLRGGDRTRHAGGEGFGHGGGLVRVLVSARERATASSLFEKIMRDQKRSEILRAAIMQDSREDETPSRLQWIGRNKRLSTLRSSRGPRRRR